MLPSMSAPRVTLASSAAFRHLDDDLPLAVDALARLGIEANVSDWDDPAVDWSAPDLVVARSCWDYTWRHEQFMAWAASVPRLANPASVLAWNSDKRYLAQLADHGVPVVTTVWNPSTIEELPPSRQWVVKPNVSAGSRDTARWSTAADVLAHARELIEAGRHAMVQPYLEGVDADGETALLFFGGEFSHCARKGPLLQIDEGVVDVESRYDLSPRDPTPAQHSLARAVLDTVRDLVPGGDDLLYARVDLIPDAAGEPVLLELEITEPSLFLPHDLAAPDRFAVAVAAALDKVTR